MNSAGSWLLPCKREPSDNARGVPYRASQKTQRGRLRRAPVVPVWDVREPGGRNNEGVAQNTRPIPSVPYRISPKRTESTVTG